MREAIGLTQGEVAEKLGVKRQSYAQLEVSEETGAISVATLAKAASAMDCDLVCFVVPRGADGRTYGELARAHDPLTAHVDATAHSMALKGPPPSP